MNRSLLILMLLVATVYTTGCKKDKTTPFGKLVLKLEHKVDNAPLVWDSTMYTNEAGNRYGIERVQYYLSDFHFYSNRQPAYAIDSVFFVDAREAGKTTFTFPDCPTGYIDSVTFLIGVAPEHNISNKLPATADNIAMGWPDMMGGGYHFLKLEGHCEDGAQVRGFAAHIGKQGFQVHAGTRFNAHVNSDKPGEIIMTMNINEWFRGPYTYNLLNGGYSMGNEQLMGLLKENGADVFRR